MKGQLKTLQDKFTELKHGTQREIVRMNENTKDIYMQFQRAQEEYDYLKAIQDSSVTDYQAQIL